MLTATGAFRAWWSLVVVVVAATAAAGLCIVYTNQQQRQSDSKQQQARADFERRQEQARVEADRRWCELLSSLDQPQAPATTERGQRIQEQIHRLRADLGCEVR